MDNDYKEHLYALILAGGGGTRLWPRSRNETPKQFLKLFGNKTLTQITVDRFRKILPLHKIFIVTVSDDYKKEILKEIPDFKKENIIVEPARRETGPAHGLGALKIYEEDPDAVIITESADRLVKPVTTYLKTLKQAAKISYKNKNLIAIGVEARYPNIGYGHIKKGKKLREEKGVKFYVLSKFVEKPPLPLAIKYTKSGDYFWNAGQFVWRADSLLESLAKHQSDIYENLMKLQKVLGTRKEKKSLEKIYREMPKISIDYAVAEKEKNFEVVAAEFFWTDIGDWKEVWDNLSKDHSGNVIIDGYEEGGEIINIDTSDALIHKDGRLIAVIDVDNIVIVDTKDALLVCSKSRAQNVKQIVNTLKEKNKTEYL